MANCEKRKPLLTHMPSQVMGMTHTPHGCLGLDCIRTVSQLEHLWTPTTEQIRVKKSQQEAAGTRVVMVSSAQYLSLTHSLSLLPCCLPICLYLIFIFK